MKKIALASFALFLMGSPLVSAGKKSKTQLPEFEIINGKMEHIKLTMGQTPTWEADLPSQKERLAQFVEEKKE